MAAYNLNQWPQTDLHHNYGYGFIVTEGSLRKEVVGKKWGSEYLMRRDKALLDSRKTTGHD